MVMFRRRVLKVLAWLFALKTARTGMINLLLWRSTSLTGKKMRNTLDEK